MAQSNPLDFILFWFPFYYVFKLGFLGAGSDFQPAKKEEFAQCKQVCAEHKACAGFTFQAQDAVPTKPVKCYWKTAIHFTPQKRNGNCITPGKLGAPVCTPLPGEMGLGGYYGHYQGHWLSATSFLINQTANASAKRAADAAIATLAKVMDAWKAA